MQPLTDAQRALVEEHIYLVKAIAWGRSRGMPACVEYDDVEQAGHMGLIDAARRYDASANASFVTFARFRINGEITDFLRRLDSVSRGRRAAINAGEADEVVEVGLDAVGEMRATGPTPEEAMMAVNFSEQLRSLMDGLTGRQQTIIQRYYFDGVPMAKVAADMGCSEPNVSRIHKQIMETLRETPAFIVRRQAFRFALTSGVLRRLGSAALGLVAAFVLAAGLQAQTRVTTSSLAGTPGANPRVWVVMPNGTLSEAELENIQLVVTNGKPILRAAVSHPTVVKSKHVVQRENGTDYALSGVLDTVHRNGLLQAEGEDYTIVTGTEGVKTLRFNANAVPQVGDIIQIRELR